MRALAAVALGAGLALALALGAGGEIRRFADSESYLDCARQPLGFDFFFSARAPLAPGPSPAPEDGLYRNRPPLVPLLYRICGLEPERIVAAQTLLYAAAAATGIVLLAGAFAATLPGRLALGAALAALALTWNLSGWTRALLSEGPVLALLWLFVGATADGVAQARRGSFVAATLAAWALMFARDSAAFLVVPLLGGVLLAARRDSRRVVPRSLAAALLVVAAGAGLAQWGMQRGQRAELPLLNVLFFRIAPEPAALDWWRARGLPWGPELEPFRGRYAFERDLEIFRDPRHRPLRDWFARHGRGLYARFLAGHPGFVARQTARGAEDLFGAELATYVGPPPRGAFAALDRATRLAGAAVCALALALAAFVLRLRRARIEPLDLFPLALAAAFLLHGLAVFHADAAEPERHCFPTLIGLQVAALLALARALGGRGDAPGGVRRAAA